MAKQSYKVTCDSVQSTKQVSSARFIIAAPDEAPAAPGGVPQRMAKTVIVFQFADPKEALKYEAGKGYTVSVE